MEKIVKLFKSFARKVGKLKYTMCTLLRLLLAKHAKMGTARTLGHSARKNIIFLYVHYTYIKSKNNNMMVTASFGLRRYKFSDALGTYTTPQIS